MSGRWLKREKYTRWVFDLIASELKNKNERRIIIEKLNHEAAFEARFDVFQYIEWKREKKNLIIDLWSAGIWVKRILGEVFKKISGNNKHFFAHDFFAVIFNAFLTLFRLKGFHGSFFLFSNAMVSDFNSLQTKTCWKARHDYKFFVFYFIHFIVWFVKNSKRLKFIHSFGILIFF